MQVQGKVLFFTAPYSVDVRRATYPDPGEGELLIRSRYSAISAGTELLAYRNQLPPGVPLDESIPEMQSTAAYPFRYGYSLVGNVAAVGPSVDTTWLGKRVFAFHPHESHALLPADQAVLLPDSLSDEDALFLANMETAVALSMDGRPAVGEHVCIVGLGVVGLLLSAILGRMPLGKLTGVDLLVKRRGFGQLIGGAEVEAPEQSSRAVECDLVYELSGTESGLRYALSKTGYKGRLVVGSWFGANDVSLDLGSYFHRSKMTLYASQVSRIDPAFSGRWNKNRRLAFALHMLEVIKPGRLITHQYSIDHASEAYTLLDQRNADGVQVVLSY